MLASRRHQAGTFDYVQLAALPRRQAGPLLSRSGVLLLQTLNVQLRRWRPAGVHVTLVFFAQ